MIVKNLKILRSHLCSCFKDNRVSKLADTYCNPVEEGK